jgi:hypothetical protein
LATSGYFLLATSGYFHMATDSTARALLAARERHPRSICHKLSGI